MSIDQIPTVNACLNGIATFFLVAGYFAIKADNRKLHTRFMASALVFSTLFLICYLFYHFNKEVFTTYPHMGVSRVIYYFILATHIPLAALIVPFVFYAVYQAWRGNYAKHVRVVKFLWPTWLYVSITGVIIYLMLYT